jgi:phosphoribosyl-ATP pyrophosphohydrolase|tara:strand:- start:5339 stop:6118 length:780 start_codon:yes stop_codon:yes gene_type:complete
MYYVYHIPNKKIGVTKNPKKRVEEQQGYKHGEYYIVYSTEDISVASIMEKELQIAYGYKVDLVLYENLNCSKQKTMKVNSTEQTTTFNCPLNKLKGRLIDKIDTTIETEHSNIVLNNDVINWIMKNAVTSQFSKERCYIYNKAYREFENKYLGDEDVDSSFFANTFNKIRAWAMVRGIYRNGNSHTQYVKLIEEAGELAKALLKKDKPEIIDAIGDIVVVLTNLAHLEGLEIESCIDSAYNEIKNREGKMINGTFVKNN